MPVRQRKGGKFKTLSIGKCNAAAALLAFDRRSANQCTYRRNLLRFAELVGGPFHELIHARMARKHFFLKAPDLTEAVVPQVQTSVGCKHTHCFEQIVESGGPHTQQRVAGPRQLHLFGEVLKDEKQSADWQTRKSN